MSYEQAVSLMRLINDRRAQHVAIQPEPFDLPAGYLQVIFAGPPAFMCGIAPDGRVSS